MESDIKRPHSLALCPWPSASYPTDSPTKLLDFVRKNNGIKNCYPTTSSVPRFAYLGAKLHMHEDASASIGMYVSIG